VTNARFLGTGLLALGLVLLQLSQVEAATPSKYLPDNSEAVLRIKVKELLETEIVKKNALEQIKTALRENIQLGLVFDTLGFDPLKDIDSITIAVHDFKFSPPMAGGTPESPFGGFFALVQGNFDLDKFHSTLAEAAKQMPNELSVSEHGGFKVYEAKQAGQPTYVAFLDKQTAVAGNKKDLVANAIDVHLGKRKPAPNRTIVNMLAKVSESQPVIIALPLPSAAKEAMRNNPQLAVLADNLEGFTASATVGKDATADIFVHTNDAQVAQQLRGQLEGLKLFAAAAIQGQNLPGGELLAELVQGLKTNADGKTVTLKLELTQAMIDRAK